MTSEEIAVHVVDALNQLEVPYMLVGSFSSNLYGLPRSTKDADFVLQVRDDTIGELAKRLPPSFRLDPQMSFETVTMTTRFTFRVVESDFEVECFLLSDDPHDQSRFARRVPVAFSGRMTFVPTPEDVVITKLRWSSGGRRTKDVDDVRNVLAVQGDNLDWDYIHHWTAMHGTREMLDRVRASIPPI